MTKASVRLDTGYQVVIQVRDHTLIADEPVRCGGKNQGRTATELLLGRDRHCLAYTRAFRAGLLEGGPPANAPA